jgi:ATP-dependent DNA ligase
MEGWAAEPKLDGWRARALVDAEASLRTRRGRDITAAVPSVRRLRWLRAVLDGELVAGAGTLTTSTGWRLSLAVHRHRDRAALVPFDPCGSMGSN